MYTVHYVFHLPSLASSPAAAAGRALKKADLPVQSPVAVGASHRGGLFEGLVLTFIRFLFTLRSYTLIFCNAPTDLIKCGKYRLFHFITLLEKQMLKTVIRVKLPRITCQNCNSYTVVPMNQKRKHSMGAARQEVALVKELG